MRCVLSTSLTLCAFCSASLCLSTVSLYISLSLSLQFLFVPKGVGHSIHLGVHTFSKHFHSELSISKLSQWRSLPTLPPPSALLFCLAGHASSSLPFVSFCMPRSLSGSLAPKAAGPPNEPPKWPSSSSLSLSRSAYKMLINRAPLNT